jgi:hypothetical protein
MVPPKAATWTRNQLSWGPSSFLYADDASGIYVYAPDRDASYNPDIPWLQS